MPQPKPPQIPLTKFSPAQAKVIRRYLDWLEDTAQSGYERCSIAARKDPSGSMAKNAAYWKAGRGVIRWGKAQLPHKTK